MAGLWFEQFEAGQTFVHELKITTSSQGLRPAKLLRSGSPLRSSPLIRAAFSFGPEGFKGNHRRNCYKRIVLLVETFIGSDANRPRSRHENFKSDLRSGGKHLFFEVP